MASDLTPEEFLARSPLGASVYAAVRAILAGFGPFDVRTTKSQVAFRRDRGFAYVWLPRMYLGRRGAEVVLSIALGNELDSPRFKEVAHPSSRTWMHHLEVAAVDELDDEVRGWLREAYDAAG